MASQRPASSMGRPVSRSGSVLPGAGKPPTAVRPPPTAIRVGTGVRRWQLGYILALRYKCSSCEHIGYSAKVIAVEWQRYKSPNVFLSALASNEFYILGQPVLTRAVYWQLSSDT